MTVKHEMVSVITSPPPRGHIYLHSGHAPHSERSRSSSCRSQHTTKSLSIQVTPPIQKGHVPHQAGHNTLQNRYRFSPDTVISSLQPTLRRDSAVVTPDLSSKWVRSSIGSWQEGKPEGAAGCSRCGGVGPPKVSTVTIQAASHCIH
jgi:hypothetical protein